MDRENLQLLNQHQIPLIGGEFEIWAIMHAKSDGAVHVNVMQRAPDKPTGMI